MMHGHHKEARRLCRGNQSMGECRQECPHACYPSMYALIPGILSLLIKLSTGTDEMNKFMT